jgi:hypothetical protein
MNQENFKKILDSNLDSPWYIDKYLLGTDGEDPVRHYLTVGCKVGCSPNKDFDERSYLNDNYDVRIAVACGEVISGYHHYSGYGEREGRPVKPLEIGKRIIIGISDDKVKEIELFFDTDWYVDTYKRDIPEHISDYFEFYMNYGSRLYEHCPNNDFNESGYLDMYPDVQKQVDTYNIPNGFSHYCLHGKQEERIPRPHSLDIIEAKHPGLTNPVCISKLDLIESRISLPELVKKSQPKKRINVLLHTLDTNLMFAGYETIIQLMTALIKYGYNLRIIICDDLSFSIRRAVIRFKNKENIAQLLSSVTAINITDRENSLLDYSDNDVYLTYSAWMTMLANSISNNTSKKKVYYLCQEDETVFHPYDSERFLINEIYNQPHVAIFNSKILLKHFKKRKIGIFNHYRGLFTFRKYYAFEHALHQMKCVSLEELKGRNKKKLVFYARPEPHAYRNLFEIGVMALKEAIKLEYFDDNWEFYGVGSFLRNKIIDLGSGRSLELLGKLSLDEYKNGLKDYDLGLALMYAGHPGVVAQEMEKAGLVVVTNNKIASEQYYKRAANVITSNQESVSELVESISQGIKLVGNSESRFKNISKSVTASWDETFNEKFIKSIFGKP